MAEREEENRIVDEILRHRSSHPLDAPTVNALGGQLPPDNNTINPSDSTAGGQVPLPSSAWPPSQQGDANIVDLTSDYIPPPQQRLQQGYQNYAQPSVPQPGHLQHPHQLSAGYLFPPVPPHYQQQQEQQHLGQPAPNLFGKDPAIELQAAIARTLDGNNSMPPPPLRSMPPGQQQQQQQQQPSSYLSSMPASSRDQAMQHVLNLNRLSTNPMLLNQYVAGLQQGSAGGGGSGNRGWNASHMLQQQRESGEGGSGLRPVTGPVLSSRTVSSGSGLQEAHQLQQNYQVQNYQAIEPLLRRQQFLDHQRAQELMRTSLASQIGASISNNRTYGGLGLGGLAGAYQGPYRPSSLHLSQQQQPARNSVEALQAAMAALQTVGFEGTMDPPPEYMQTVLLPHQKDALVWMSRRENGSSQPIGGILADDQGLGKTVTTISLIACNPRNGIQRVDIPPENLNGDADGGGAGTSADAAAADVDGGTKKEKDVIVIDDDNEYKDDEHTVDAGIKLEGNNKPTKSAKTTAATGQEDVEIIEEAGAPAALITAKTTSAAIPAQPRPEFGTLVVCPTTLLHQWQSEVRTKGKDIRAYIYHGKSKGISLKILATYDVVITTYQTLVLEMPETMKPPTKKGGTSNFASTSSSAAAAAASLGRQAPQLPSSSSDTSIIDLVGQGEEKTGKKRRRDPLLERAGQLFSVMWHRVVLDEAQMIKNPKTMASHAAWALRARRRWCLSGTPIQNSVDDLYSYFKFLRYEPYSKYATFKQLIKDPVEGDDPQGFNRLISALHPMLFRRTKESKDKDGKKIFTLPDRNVRLIKKEFSPEERNFYVKLKADAEADIAQYQSEGGPAGNYFNVLFKVLRMRQACNHPKLVRNKIQSFSACSGNGGGRMSTAEINAVQKLKDDLKTKLAETLRTGLTECAICFDMPEDPVVSLCNHVFCRQCVSSKFSMAGQGAAESELAFHCPTCGHALGDNQTFGANALHVVDASAADGRGTSNVPPGRSDGSSTKIDALIDVLSELRKPSEEPSLRPKGEGGLVIKNLSREHLKDEVDRLNGSSQQAQNRKRGKGGRNVNLKPPLKQKVIVFSQWTSMLDLIEDPLTREEIEFRRLDGTMTASARQAAIQDFTELSEVSVMLASLKAASLGVNLVSANHVVLMDLWFNPSAEEQAIDRAHRIGQLKDVEVTRITIKDSIEDKILELQDKKRELTDKALEGKAGKLTRDEMLSLFGVSSGGGGVGGASGSGRG